MFHILRSYLWEEGKGSLEANVGCLFLCCFALYFEMISHWNWSSSFWLAWVAKGFRNWCHRFPGAEVTGTWLLIQLIAWVVGICIQVLVSVQCGFYTTGPFPIPCFLCSSQPSSFMWDGCFLLWRFLGSPFYAYHVHFHKMRKDVFLLFSLDHALGSWSFVWGCRPE